MKVEAKTLEEHWDYLVKIVRLKLFFMHDWLTRHPDESPAAVLRDRIDIYRKTDANPGNMNPIERDWNAPAWQELEQAVLAAYDRHRHDEATFEKEAFAVLEPSLDARLERDYRDDSPLARYQCGSLRHDLYDAPTQSAGFHIANAVSPKSLFDDPLYLPCCFLILMDQVEMRYGAEAIRTHTWLNDNPKWLAFFPQEWHDRMSGPDTDVNWSYAFWGQFITARGTFNDKLGDYARQHRRFKFYPRESECTIAAMRRHLMVKYFAAVRA